MGIADSLRAATSRLITPIPLRRFGWAFLLAWVACIFYTNAVAGYGTAADESIERIGGGFAMSLLPVGSSVAMLAVIVALERKLGSPFSIRSRCPLPRPQRRLPRQGRQESHDG